jgi:hypothetical protein
MHVIPPPRRLRQEQGLWVQGYPEQDSEPLPQKKRGTEKEEEIK